MQVIMLKFFLIFWLIIDCWAVTIFSQDKHQVLDKKPRLFIEGSNIDFDYLRSEVSFIDYVRDRRQSDIYLRVTRRETGSNGSEYIMIFTGQGIFNGINDTLLYFTRSTYSKVEERVGFVRTLKRGLISYINRTPFADNIEITYDETVSKDKLESYLNDPWDYWIFNIELEGWMNGESQIKSFSLNTGINSERITIDWKLRFHLGIGYIQDDYTYEDEKFLSISRNRFLEAEIIKSIGDYIGLGIFSDYSSSTYQNIKHEITIYPAIEYNFFPYSESYIRQLTIAYRIGYDWNIYMEPTIFDKMKEAMFKQRMDLDLEFKEQWGEVNFEINYITILKDISRNRLELKGGVSINILEGFGIELNVGYSKIRDQYAIPKSQLSLDELLLKRRELLTQYNYWGSIGFSYTFGSIFNNVVNTRF